MLGAQEALAGGVKRVAIADGTCGKPDCQCFGRECNLDWRLRWIGQRLKINITSGVYAKRGLAIISGQGATLTDADGKVYIDCVGGQGTANIGHAHPRWVKAITDQAGVLLNCPEMFSNDQRASLYAGIIGGCPVNDATGIFLQLRYRSH